MGRDRRLRRRVRPDIAIVGIGIVVAAVALKNQIIGALERTANRVNTVS